MDLQNHIYDEEYTANKNADFCTSLFNMITMRQFRDLVLEKIYKTFSQFSVFSKMAISI